mmetsp:Transcript_110139/g.201870  ORF Transcript_110139/g.201870 Transcript_110139/m.201870 type:complete len:187 (-) Transcript_110139:203-763(-)
MNHACWVTVQLPLLALLLLLLLLLGGEELCGALHDVSTGRRLKDGCFRGRRLGSKGLLDTAGLTDIDKIPVETVATASKVEDIGDPRRLNPCGSFSLQGTLIAFAIFFALKAVLFYFLCCRQKQETSANPRDLCVNNAAAAKQKPSRIVPEADADILKQAKTEVDDDNTSLNSTAVPSESEDSLSH